MTSARIHEEKIIVFGIDMKILIVDDDEFAIKTLKIILSKYGDVSFAHHGQMAIELFKAAHERYEPFDLICLDIMMPQMDGHETLRMIRKIEDEKGIVGLDGVKIIMISALSGSNHVLGAFKEGCEAYLFKPFKKSELLKKIEELGFKIDQPEMTA